MKKVILNFLGFSISNKIVMYRNVIAKMIGNQSFPTPVTSVVDATAAVDALEAANILALDGGHNAILKLHDAEVVCDIIFRHQAGYVDRISQGNETIISSSGFHCSVGKGGNVKAELAVVHGIHSGSIKLVAKAIEDAGAYIWEMSIDPIAEDGSSWKNVGHSKHASIELLNLIPGQKYWLRMSAIVSEGTTDFTAPVSIIVL